MQIRLPDKINLIGENQKLLSASNLEMSFEGDILIPKIVSADAPLSFLVFTQGFKQDCVPFRTGYFCFHVLFSHGYSFRALKSDYSLHCT